MHATYDIRPAAVRPRFRGAWERSKDARADAAVRLATVKERHGDDACDVIEMTATGYRTVVDDLYGKGLVELARAVHTTGRLRKVSDGRWVVTKG